jgi:hypothetical protein
MLNHYVGNGTAQALHVVIIAPQSDEQEEAIATLLPDVRRGPIAGGNGYMVGPYFSEKYAQIICDQYRALDFFTVVMSQGAM